MTDTLFFDPKQFKSLKLKIRFKNLVSQTELPDGSAHLIQIGDKSLTFETPIRTCAQGHNIMVTIFETELNPTPENPIFVATGKVRAIDLLDDHQSQSTQLDLIQYEEEDWNKLESLYSQRQNEILEFMKAARD